MTPKKGILVIYCDHISHMIVKMHYFFLKSSSLLTGIDPTNLLLSQDGLGKVYQNCKFYDPLGRTICASVLGRGHSQTVKMLNFCTDLLLNRRQVKSKEFYHPQVRDLGYSSGCL